MGLWHFLFLLSFLHMTVGRLFAGYTTPRRWNWWNVASQFRVVGELCSSDRIHVLLNVGCAFVRPYIVQSSTT